MSPKDYFLRRNTQSHLHMSGVTFPNNNNYQLLEMRSCVSKSSGSIMGSYKLNNLRYQFLDIVINHDIYYYFHYIINWKTPDGSSIFFFWPH